MLSYHPSTEIATSFFVESVFSFRLSKPDRAVFLLYPLFIFCDHFQKMEDLLPILREQPLFRDPDDITVDFDGLA